LQAGYRVSSSLNVGQRVRWEKRDILAPRVIGAIPVVCATIRNAKIT